MQSGGGFDRVRWFAPRFAGDIGLASIPADYVARLERRVEEGFLVRGNRTRANYLSQRLGDEGISIVANDFWTATNIGLNEIILHRRDVNHISYEVRFGRWTRYGVLLGISILVVGMTLYWAVGRSWAWPSQQGGILPGLAGLLVGLFFYLLWPWIFTEMHKKPAARCLERIVRETLAV